MPIKDTKALFNHEGHEDLVYSNLRVPRGFLHILG